jgi:Reverse transcriptase (RNA-dependent DNA polymerase)
MAYRLSAAALAHAIKHLCEYHAIKHLCEYGDTDVFPHLPELAFLREQETAVIRELKDLDLDTYRPGSAFEALGPKSRYGFRIVHQMPILDTVLLLAAVIEIGALVEGHRAPVNGLEAFSYRFAPDGKGSLFRLDRTFKDWLNAQLAFVQSNLKIKRVIATDISDFYARINFHRLENLLDEVAPKHGAARYITKHIKVIRAKQSFGLPVGGSAARLLAELALSDTDRALQQDGRIATRFVDDIRIFLRAKEDTYDALAFIAEQLGINEGLSLNVAKTTVYTRAEFLARLKHLVTDVTDEAEGAALDSLTSDLYFDDEPDPDELEELKSMNLLGFLQEEVGKDSFDMGRIKVIFRALKLVKPTEAVDYISGNFAELVVFAKEVTLLMQVLETENPGCFDDLTDAVIDAILAPPASSIQLIKTWLLELFVRGVVPITAAGIKQLEVLSSVLDRRQLHLIRGRNGDKNFFRKNKTAFDQLSALEQPCFVWGASCLPKDEYETWLSTVKPMFAIPTGGLFLKWAQREREKLIGKLDASTDDHQE